MSTLSVLKQMDDERTQELLERNRLPRFSDDLESSTMKKNKYKMVLKKRGPSGILNELLRENDDNQAFKNFKIARG
jgi:hypothetical protein